MYLLRLDDASEYLDIEKWNKIEEILDVYEIKPIVGIIPDNEDKELISKNKKDSFFWEKARKWQSKGWIIALHGYNHVYITSEGGVNPINNRSEFAGVSLNIQRQKIRDGINIFKNNNLNAEVFFAPFHTYDINTLEALKTESDIRIVCDTVANDIYKEKDFYFIPQQSGTVRRLPFKVVTFCYHPNNMSEYDFKKLENFIKKNKFKFKNLSSILLRDRKLNLLDIVLRKSYFTIRKLKAGLRRRF